MRHALPVRREVADGPADPGLSEAGRAQSERLAAYLSSERIDALYSSPMRRAVQTAMPIGDAHHLSVEIEEDVAEWDRHSNEYIPVEELKRANDPRWQQLIDGIRPDGAPSAAEFQAVVVAALERLISSHSSQRVAVVCHGGVLAALYRHVRAIPVSASQAIPIPNASYNALAFESGAWTVEAWADTAHLEATAPFVEP